MTIWWLKDASDVADTIIHIKNAKEKKYDRYAQRNIN
jgi:hypothetical protein